MFDSPTLVPCNGKHGAAMARMKHQELRKGLIRLHILHHTAEEGFYGQWHEARADFCTLLGSLYLLIEGGGRWSLDALLNKKQQAAP